MKVTDYIHEAGGKTLISFEILPPLKGGSIQTIFKAMDPVLIPDAAYRLLPENIHT